MALFRFHRGCLEPSLLTTVIVKNQEELKKVIMNSMLPWSASDQIKNLPDFSIKIETPYGISLEDSFDPRCGWYTHYVTANVLDKERFVICGFLSEPLEN